MRRICMLGVIAGGLLAPPAGPAGAASPGAAEAVAPDSPFGVVAHVTRPGEHGLAQREFALMKEAGIAWVRTDFDWDRVENPEGTWHFDHLDETVAWADAAGIRLLAQLNYNVPWADPAHRHLGPWLTYVRKVVGRYCKSVRHWEVWNEPNTERFWRSPDPAEYTAFLKVTHQAIKEIDPDLRVVFGGTCTIDIGYIEGALRAGAADYFDVMSVHPYGTSPDNVGNDLARLHEVMKRHGAADRPVWVTEWGWSAVGNKPAEEREHAVNLAIGWHIALHDRLAARIFWYEFQSEEVNPADPEHYFGLVRKDLAPRPAYLAYQALTRARPAGSEAAPGDWWRQGLTWPHWVRPDGRKGWAVWAWSGEKPYRLFVRGEIAEAFDVLGRPVRVEVKDRLADVTLSRSPLYLIGPEYLSFEERPDLAKPGLPE